MSLDALQELAEDLGAIVEAVDSFGGTELLARARSLLVQSWFDYELLVTACLVGFHAVEATFRQIVFPDAGRRSFRNLVDRSERDGLFDHDKAEILRAGVELRNLLSHPDGSVVFTLGMADSMLRTSHLLVRQAASLAAAS